MKVGHAKSRGKKLDRCTLYVYISVAQRRKLEKIATQSCKSLSSLIRDLLEEKIINNKG